MQREDVFSPHSLSFQKVEWTDFYGMKIELTQLRNIVIPVGYFVHLLPVALVDKVPPGEQVGLQVAVEHELHHCVDGLTARTHPQQLDHVLHVQKSVHRVNSVMTI